MAKVTQKTLSEPKINYYYRIHQMDWKKFFNNESMNFSQNWISTVFSVNENNNIIFRRKKL